MNCKTAEQAMLEHGTDLPEPVREHLAACPSCQGFARLQQVLIEQDPGAGPSPALDRAVLAAAHARLRRGWGLLPRLRPFYRAAAALLVVAGGIYVLVQRQPGTPPPSSLAAAARHWAGAQVDLEVIEGGLDAALAELGGLGTPASGQDGSVDRTEPWDALTELEFDVYFAAEYLQQSGG